MPNWEERKQQVVACTSLSMGAHQPYFARQSMQLWLPLGSLTDSLKPAIDMELQLPFATAEELLLKSC